MPTAEARDGDPILRYYRVRTRTDYHDPSTERFHGILAPDGLSAVAALKAARPDEKSLNFTDCGEVTIYADEWGPDRTHRAAVKEG